MKEGKKIAVRANKGPTCPQCGGPMYYDYPEGRWKCFDCDSI